MKFKKTKLTALAMSVLMAMSTITSVTWAADLFSDGTPAETVVEEPVDVDPTVEDEIVAEDASLNGYSAADLRGVQFDVVNGKVVARYTLNTPDGEKTFDDTTVQMANKVSATCLHPEYAIYSATFNLGTETVKVLSDETTLPSGTVNSANPIITDAARTWSDRLGTPAVIPLGYIVTPGSTTLSGIVGHAAPAVDVDFVVRNASCTVGSDGLKYTYKACPACGTICLNGDYQDGALDNLNDQQKEAYLLNQMQQGGDITRSNIPVNDHSYDETNLIILDEMNFSWVIDGVRRTPQWLQQQTVEDRARFIARATDPQYIGNFILVNQIQNNELSKYAPYNCLNINGAMQVADPENGRDSYYYTIVKCKNCNTVRVVSKEYLKDTSAGVEGDYYEEVEGGNVLGFLAISGRGDSFLNTAYSGYGTIRGYVSFANNRRISTSNPNLVTPLVPVLDDCNKAGYYYIRTYVRDTPEAVHTEMKTVERVSHVWGSVELATNGLKYADGTTEATDEAKLLSVNEGNLGNNELLDANGFVVVRDNQGNVIEAKSKNCITTANYELYHQCLKCGRIEKTEAKTAPFNTDRHQWGPWSDPRTDKEDNKYYQIEGEEHDSYHMVYTYYHRTCDLCGKRDLKLAEEKKEAHQLVETKYDNEGEDSTYVAPTCGESGHYDVILRCACGYEDTESRKQEIIPATDRHDFGENPAEIQIVGEIQVGGRGVVAEPETGVLSHIVYAQIVRKCNVCGQYDSNGINNMQPNTAEGVFPAVGPTIIVDTVREGRTFTDYVPAKKDPSTGVTYPCSYGKITVNFNWAGKVDGKTVKLSASKTVPYYVNEATYAGARAHEPGEVVIENKVDATAETAGSYDKVIYCRVCGDEISRETITVDPEEIIPVPTAKATAVNYNTINVTWNAVEGATSYNVYYRSAALGVNDWTLAKNVTGTSFNYSGLITGVKYRFTVSAVKGENSSEFGVNTSVATPKLAAPVIKTVTAVKKGTKVTWTKVDGANGYIIQSKTASGKWTRVATLKKGAKVSWTDKKAASGTTYRVRAYRTVDAPNISKNNVYGPFSAAK